MFSKATFELSLDMATALNKCFQRCGRALQTLIKDVFIGSSVVNAFLICPESSGMFRDGMVRMKFIAGHATRSASLVREVAGTEDELVS